MTANGRWQTDAWWADVAALAQHGTKKLNGMREILDHAAEGDRLIAAVGDDKPADVRPLFHSVDDGEVTGLFVVGGVSREAFAKGALNTLAGHVVEEAAITASYLPMNWQLLTHFYGAGIVAPMIELVRDAVADLSRRHVRYEIRRWPLDDDGEEIEGEGEPPLRTAPIDTDDDDFAEEGFATCDPGADHARLITSTLIDSDLLATVIDLVRDRSAAALRVLRGDAP